MNNKVKIEVYDDNGFINYLVYHYIKYSSLIKCDNYYSLIVSIDDYKKISRRYKTTIIKYYGRNGLINFIKYHKYMLISLMISLMLLNILTHTIFEIRIDTDDEELKTIIMSDLNNNGISLYKKKKRFEELTIIKENILSNNKDLLEWLEINEKGTIYIVNLTKRVKNNNIEINNEVSSIIAKKDGLIKHITASSGVKKVDINDYVKKGDILISGNIIKNEELITQVKSIGEVYAEVWYIVSISIPFDYTEYVETGNIINRYYLDINGNEFTLTGKYDSDNVICTKKLLLDKPYLFFKLYKENKREYEYKEYHVNESEAYNEALKRSELQIKNRLNNDEYIISKKVLKKVVKNDKMYLEVFFKVYENIGVTSNIEDIGENDASSN